MTTQTSKSVVWGVVLLVECVVRVVGACTVPVDTTVWLGSVILIGAMAVPSWSVVRLPPSSWRCCSSVR